MRNAFIKFYKLIFNLLLLSWLIEFKTRSLKPLYWNLSFKKIKIKDNDFRSIVAPTKSIQLNLNRNNNRNRVIRRDSSHGFGCYLIPFNPIFFIFQWYFPFINMINCWGKLFSWVNYDPSSWFLFTALLYLIWILSLNVLVQIQQFSIQRQKYM